MNTPLISVIVPVYNVEKYLPRCIDSILNQTYKNLEIILVDDGSPDNCPAICDEYATKDSRIKVVHKKNGGLSAARNAGLKVAEGKFVGFVDSDDYIENNMYETLFFNLEKYDADMSICAVKTVDEYNHDTTNLKEAYIDLPPVISNIEGISLLCQGAGIFISACNKLYKKSLFDNRLFVEGIYHEDWQIMPYILCRCEQIACSALFLYTYFQRSGSIRHDASVLYKRYIDSFYSDCERADLFIENGLAQFLKSCVWYMYMDLIHAYEHSEREKNRIEELREAYKKYSYTAKKIENQGIKIEKNKKLIIRLINTFPKLFYFIYFRLK